MCLKCLHEVRSALSRVARLAHRLSEHRRGPKFGQHVCKTAFSHRVSFSLPVYGKVIDVAFASGGRKRPAEKMLLTPKHGRPNRSWIHEAAVPECASHDGRPGPGRPR